MPEYLFSAKRKAASQGRTVKQLLHNYSEQLDYYAYIFIYPPKAVKMNKKEYLQTKKPIKS